MRGSHTRSHIHKFPAEAGPLVHLQKQVGDLDARKRLADETFNRFRFGWLYALKRRNRDESPAQPHVGQLTFAELFPHFLKALVEEFAAFRDVPVKIHRHADRQFPCRFQFHVTRARHQVLLEVLVLAAACHRDVTRAQVIPQL